MAESRNIEIFQELVARYLNRLYFEFPNPTRLDVSWAGHEVAALLESKDDEAMRILTRDGPSSMVFLVREGFVTFEPSRRTLSDSASTFPGAVLTLKGFSLLGATPKAVDVSAEHRPIAEQLSEAINDGARATVRDLVSRLFVGALSAGASAFVG